MSQRSLILGLDVSTSVVGVALYSQGTVVSNGAIILPTIKKGTDLQEELLLKRDVVEAYLQSLPQLPEVTAIGIEAPIFATGKSNAKTVTKLIQFNTLVWEWCHRTLHILPTLIPVYDARELAYPEIMDIRTVSKAGEQYDRKHILNSLKKGNLVAFGAYPYDCDKKEVMMDLNERYLGVSYDRKKKESGDMSDALVIARALDQSRSEPPAILNYTDKGNHIEYTVQTFNGKFERVVTLS